MRVVTIGAVVIKSTAEEEIEGKKEKSRVSERERVDGRSRPDGDAFPFVKALIDFIVLRANYRLLLRGECATRALSRLMNPEKKSSQIS